MKVALYARYSTELQDKTSITGQFRNCEAIALEHGCTVAARFKDEAASGTDDRRTGYRSLLRAVEMKEFDGIIVDETSRLTRNAWELPRLLEELQFRGQFLLARGFDSRQENAHLLAGIYSGIDRIELHKIKQRTHRGLRERHLEGFSAGGRTYGYKSEAVEPGNPDSRWRRLIEPTEALWVRWIFERYASGMGAKAIAAELNRLGVPSPGAHWKRTQRRSDGKWQHSAIIGMAARGSGILRNEIYIGKVIWNRSEWVRRPGRSTRSYRLRPRSDWIVEDRPELLIVAEDLWDRVQARLMERQSSAKKPGRRGRYLLTGLLKCAHCGGALTMVNQRSYGCGTRNRGGDAACDNRVLIRREEVERRFLADVRAQLLSPSTISWAERQVALALTNTGRPNGQQTNQELANVESEIEHAVQAICKIGISEALEAKLKVLERRKRELTAEIREARAAPRTFDSSTIIAGWRSQVGRLGDLAASLSAAELAEARAALKGFLGEVRVDQNGLGHANLSLQRLVAGGRFQPNIRRYALTSSHPLLAVR